MLHARLPCGRARWGVVQLVGHLTVNEDGEGSNPSAPAKIPLSEQRTLRRLVSLPQVFFGAFTERCYCSRAITIDNLNLPPQEKP
jgi:hypothetical protein